MEASDEERQGLDERMVCRRQQQRRHLFAGKKCAALRTRDFAVAVMRIAWQGATMRASCIRVEWGCADR
jgi:hypothetical protein